MPPCVSHSLALSNHGSHITYIEPDYPVTLLESTIPVPGATYACAAAQQCFARMYVYSMRSQLPGCTALVFHKQRLDQNLPDRDRRLHGM